MYHEDYRSCACYFTPYFGGACSAISSLIWPALSLQALGVIGIVSSLVFIGIVIGLYKLCTNTRFSEEQELEREKLEPLLFLHEEITNIIESQDTDGNKKKKLGEILYNNSDASNQKSFIRDIELLRYLSDNFITTAVNGEKEIDTIKIKTFCQKNNKPGKIIEYEIIEFLAQVCLNIIEAREYDISCMADQLLSFYDQKSQEEGVIATSVPCFSARLLDNNRLLLQH